METQIYDIVRTAAPVFLNPFVLAVPAVGAAPALRWSIAKGSNRSLRLSLHRRSRTCASGKSSAFCCAWHGGFSPIKQQRCRVF